MHKRILSFFLVFALLFSAIPLVIFADEHQHTFGDNKRGLDMGSLPDEYSCPATFYETPCESLCGYSKYEWTFAGASDSFVDVSGLNALQVYSRWRKWFEKAYGASANLEKMDTTNAGANIPAAGGRNPKGYGDEGKANITSTGTEVLWVEPFGVGTQSSSGFFSTAPKNLIAANSGSGSGTSYPSAAVTAVVYYFTAPISGLYYIGSSGSPYDFGSINFFYGNKWNRIDYIVQTSTPYRYSCSLTKGQSTYFYYYVNNGNAGGCPFKFYLNRAPIFVEPLGDSSITTVNNITITNNNYTQNWNGNIYTDNSTNLTYIYPQYTTIDESGDTVTNISNNPIIYNNETKQYYTYDQTTKNYYYITYNTQPTPSPSPTPAPTDKPDSSISTPETGKPGGDTGDTTGILAVLVEIRDNMIQGFLDIKTAFVAGFADLSANFTLAIENLNLNITNIFNKKFPDQSTPETAQPSPTPDVSPSPTPSTPETGEPTPSPSPSPTPDPDVTPTPTPGPTNKPDSGDKTNNFWTIIFPNGGGSEDGKKGIFWALVSLILALIAFFSNLAVGVGYLFPFLPDGVVMTINTCLIVIFLFTIIKFIMRSK